MDQNIEGYIETDRKKLSPAEPDKYFYLRVRGDSMIGAGINDGDVVLVSINKKPKTGDIVAAMTNESAATLKTLKIYDNRVELIPNNPEYKSFTIRRSDFENGNAGILGVVIEILKEYEITS